MSEDQKLFVRGMRLGKAPDKWSFEKHPDESELNLFRYCSNDPLDLTDPMGLSYGTPMQLEDLVLSTQAKQDVTGSHIPASAQNLLNTRTLAGLSTTRAKEK